MAYTSTFHIPGSAFFRKKAAAVVLFFLGRAIRCLYTMDSSIRAEIDGLPEGLVFTITAAKNGPSLHIRKMNGRPVILKTLDTSRDSGAGQSSDKHIILEFKSIGDALLVLFGSVGPAQAYAQHRFILYGDIYQAMPLVRCLLIVEAYLFPPFITRKFLTGPVPLKAPRLKVYLSLFKN